MFYKVPENLTDQIATGYAAGNFIAPPWDGPWESFGGAGGLQAKYDLCEV